MTRSSRGNPRSETKDVWTSIDKAREVLNLRLQGRSRRRLEREEICQFKKHTSAVHDSSKLSKRRRKKLRRRLHDAIIYIDNIEQPQASLLPPSRTQRSHQEPDHFTFDTKTPTLDWELRRITTQAERVLLTGPPVFMDFGARRAPCGFRDAATYIRGLGSGIARELPSREEKPSLIGPQPVMIKVLAPQTVGSGGKRPWDYEWEDITHDPSCALTKACYLQVYYGGDDAKQLQERARARLPASLILRGHQKSLINFVSLTPSYSGTHFDGTPSVLVCLAKTREVWLAPPHVKKACSLSGVPGQTRYLDYDPRADGGRHRCWQHVELTEGQALFIPAKWWHAVYGSAGSIGMSLDVERASVRMK
jgi:hypothetical protein